MSRLCAFLLVCLPLLAGCAAPGLDEGQESVTFVVIAAPTVGGDAEDAELLAEEVLLEAVTQLSSEIALDLCLVPGPLLGADDAPAREGLVGALGSLAAPVYVALGPNDGPREELLDLLAESLAGHKGDAAYYGERVGSLRPVVLDPSGALPPNEGNESEEIGDDADDDGGPSLVAVQGGAALEGGDRVPLIVVASGPAVKLEAVGGGARLELPPLSEPPHIFALVRLEKRKLIVTLHSALGLPVPAAPAPLQLSR